MKRVLIAPDSFKQTLSATEVCEIVSHSLKERYSDIHIDCIPVADGGEGTAEAFLYALGGEKVYCTVRSPLGRDISAYYALLPDGSAVIEMAQASGIGIEEKNDPLKSSTYGTGQLLEHAIKSGVRNFYIALGGSATTDGGIGCMGCLGVKFLDEDKNEVSLCGDGLCELDSVDPSGLLPEVKECSFTVLCDVKNSLYGKNGAAYIFAPQKGADEKQVDFLDRGLSNLAQKVKDCLQKDFSSYEGAGAAGGLGFALTAFLGAQMKSGAEAVLEITHFSEKAKQADLVITGEGKMDLQSLMGKVPFAVAQKSGNTKVMAIVGVSEIDADTAKRYGIQNIIETNPLHLSFDEIKHKSEQMLNKACEKISV